MISLRLERPICALDTPSLRRLHSALLVTVPEFVLIDQSLDLGLSVLTSCQFFLNTPAFKAVDSDAVAPGFSADAVLSMLALLLIFLIFHLQE